MIIQAISNLRPTSSFTLMGDTYDTLIWQDPNTEPPTKAEVDAEQARIEAQQPLDDCKKQASELLYETDWTTIPDVANPANNPYLTNQADFIAYRNTVRQLAVNPVANPAFPTKPTEQWSS
jgi:hypothetical protein